MKNDSQTTEDNRDSGILSNPPSFLLSGRFYWGNAGLSNRNNYGYFWSSRSNSVTYSSPLYFGNTSLGPEGSDPRGNGFAVR